ncbi:MAG: amino acid adenylation domain-containing protein, partial [Pyrinomonadaceae bacterium]
AYLPLDPSYPRSRRAFMLADAGACLLVTDDGGYEMGDDVSHAVGDGNNGSRVAAGHNDDVRNDVSNGSSHAASDGDVSNGGRDVSDDAGYDGDAATTLLPSGCTLLDLRRDSLLISSRPSLPLSSSAVSPMQPAYINYTSGSTGTPKGIVIPHRAVSRLVLSANYLQLTERDCVAQASNASFDALTFEVWGALLSGARLSGVSTDVVLSPVRYARWISEQGVTALFLTTALFNEVARSAPWAFTGVEAVLFGGQAADALCVRLMVEERERSGWPKRLLHVYGPTESTTFATWQEVEEVRAEARSVAIGRAIGNTRVYVMDGMGRMVGVGVVGELYIGGEGLAQGYVGRAEQTAERFVQDGVSGVGGESGEAGEDGEAEAGRERGARLYRTGDLVRWSAGGELEYVGRMDDQVKVRGYRIEPGEIAAVLREHGAVRDAVVVAMEDERGEGKRLVGYVVWGGEEGKAGRELREYVKERLPEYMMPSVIVTLDEMPLNENGKVDRRRLPAPESGVGDEGESYVGARTPEEELLAGIFAHVLNVSRVGVHDSFFDLGGHSLLATQVVSRIREVFEVELPLRQLFETPTVADLVENIRQARLAGQGRLAPPIRPDRTGGFAPLSFAQQRLWFLDQFEPESPFYNIPAALRLDGPLRLDALGQSLSEIVRRHGILRTNIPRTVGQPVQVLAAPQPLAVDFADFGRKPPVEAAALVERMAREEVLRPFNLAHGPLLRLSLLRLSTSSHVLLLTQHHIVSDGWSIGIFFRELVTLYHAFVDGAQSPLDELEIQYEDFARWQREWLQGEELERQLAYWRRQLAGAPTVVQLPTDRPRPVVETFRGAIEPFALTPDLSGPLKSLCEREGVTTFMLLLVAFGALLHRYTGQDDLLVGAPIANRHRAETEELIGFFINTLALRERFEGGEITFRDLLAQVRHTCLEAYAHQDLPFEKLVGELVLERETSHNPLVQVVLAFQNVPLAGMNLSGLTLTPLAVTNDTSLFDLTLSLSETPAGLVGYIQYSTSLFDATTIRRMKGHFATLLEGLAADPWQRVCDAPLLTGAERQQLAAEWSAAVPAPDLPCLHEMFAAQAVRRPDAVALVSEEGTLSYGALNGRANQVANLLRQLGAGPESVVGLCVERTNELIIGLLGILKAGAAYLPLDPHNPAARTDYMLAEAGARLLLTGSGTDRSWPQDIRVVRLDADPNLAAQPRAHGPRAVTSAGSLAYVIYTSGSTNVPKGVMVTHRNVARLMKMTERDFAFDEQDVWTLFHSSAFDFSVWEMWGALSYGGRLVVVPYWVSRSTQLFRELLAQECVTVLNQTPSAFRQLIKADETRPDGAPLRSLRRVIFGGEALELKSLRPWFERHGDRQPKLVNMYGITETTVHVTYRELSAADARQTPGSVIGRPIDDLRLYVLGAANQLVPAGVPGQLCVSGEGVARGYLKRPDLTAERFTPDPFATQPGARIYQSGDLGRHLSDGDIEYLGRMDHQVKVRGFRIELGEIEATLLDHPSVREAVVLSRCEAGGEPQLIAYIVAAGTDGLNVALLRGHAQERLPEYMIPAAFVLLEVLPLTPNGKVDRKALPASGQQQRLEPSGVFEAPRTPVEQILANVWAKVLGVERVGRDDNFFELGGDSIMSIQVTSRVAGEGYSLTPKQLFLNPTIGQLAAVMSRTKMSAGDERDTDDRPFALTPIQHWFFEQDLTDAHHWNQSVMLQFRPSLDVATLLAAMRATMSYHDALGLRFHRDADGWRQSAGDDSAADSCMRIDLRLVPDAVLPRIIEAAAGCLQTSLDLCDGPLWRVAAFDCGPGRPGRLLVVVHHLVVDGVSWRILLQDLQTVYGQLQAGQGISLPPRTTSYRRWARAVADYAATFSAGAETAYWLEVAGASAAVLPTDESGGENTVESARVVSRSLSLEETKSLLTRIPAIARAQINEVLLTALARTLCARAGSPVLVDIEGHGREEIAEGIDLSRTVGWFTTIYPVLLDVDPTFAPADTLVAVKEGLRRVPGNGFGYGLLRYLSGDETVVNKLRAAPRSQVCFNYLGQFDQMLDESAPLRLSTESTGGPHSPRARRLYEIEITCSVQGGQLRLALIYSRNLHHAATVESLADELVARLRTLITDLHEPEAASLTTSDFPRAQVSQADLNTLMARLGKSRPGGSQ